MLTLPRFQVHDTSYYEIKDGRSVTEYEVSTKSNVKHTQLQTLEKTQQPPLQKK